MPSMEKCARTFPPYHGSEKEMLLAYLDFQRDTAICKLQGMSEEDARRTLGPSSLTLVGIVSHLTYVERVWFRSVLLGEDMGAAGYPDDMSLYWDAPEGASIDDVIAGYREEVARSNETIRSRRLDEVAATGRRHRPPMQLRWIMLHMIEEVARHLGHMDLIRESIDGQVGA
jgi:uncharacterized damage-inducible protein DinB